MGQHRIPIYDDRHLGAVVFGALIPIEIRQHLVCALRLENHDLTHDLTLRVRCHEGIGPRAAVQRIPDESGGKSTHRGSSEEMAGGSVRPERPVDEQSCHTLISPRHAADTLSSMPVIGLTCWERPFDTNYARAERTHMLSSTYTTALVAAGATPVLLPSIGPEHAERVVSAIDGLVISGGGDIDPGRYGAENTRSSEVDTERDAWELALVSAARRRGVPLLGICRGCQLLNVAFGGTLHQHVWDSEAHPDLWNEDRTMLVTGHHDVALTGILTKIYGEDARRVNGLHHQAIDRLGDGLEVVATAPDGGIEAVATTDSWTALAVQWHPERLADEQALFGWITEQAAR